MAQDLSAVILFLIDQSSKQAKRYSQRIFDEQGLGITVDQWVLMKIIDEHARSSQQEIAAVAKRDGASITRSLELLEKKGFVLRTPRPDSKREYQVQLSRQGKAFVDKHMNMIDGLRSLSLKGFSQTEVENLREMLLRIQANMS